MHGQVLDDYSSWSHKSRTRDCVTNTQDSKQQFLEVKGSSHIENYNTFVAWTTYVIFG